MNHYEQLGVEPDATAGEIKRAYRSKAREKHPDKGGSSAEFAPVVAAYEVLIDPSRRLLYDTTGQDQRTPIEKEVQQVLLHLFNEALSKADDIAIVEFVRLRVRTGSVHVAEQRKELKSRQKKLKAKRGTIKSTTAVNVAHLVIDGELKKISAGLLEMDHQDKVQKAVLAEIESYSEKWQAPDPPTFTQTIYFRV